MKIGRTDKEPKEKKDSLGIIGITLLVSVICFIFIKLIRSLIILLVGLIIQYWAYALGGIVALFILKRIVFGRKKK